MKPTAFFVNTARGPIVDQAALTRVLQGGRIAGAALDVFEDEPMPLPNPLTELDNVILAPHAVAWTDQSAEGNGNEAINHILTVLRGEVPGPVVNRDVVAHPGFTAKLAANAARWREWAGQLTTEAEGGGFHHRGTENTEESTKRIGIFPFVSSVPLW